MSIDRIIPRSLNTDDDYLVVEATEMVDALNITIASDEEGNAGVIKIAYGNTKINFTSGNNLPSGTNKVVGSCMNREKGEILFAVYNSSNNHSIYWHNIVTGQLRLVFRDEVLGFTADGWIKMDTLIKENNETLLYFNDTLSDPKKINVTRALNKSVNGYPYTSLSYLDVFNQPQVYDYSAEEKLLSLTVAKQPPLDPPVVAFASDLDVKFNRLYDNHFQFAYQYVYEDGEVSAISPWSENPVNSSQLLDNLADRDQSVFNRINITFRRNLGDVSSIRILGKRYLNNSFFLIKEVPNQRSIVAPTDSASFYNNEGYEFIQERETNKLFDAIPLKSNSQSLVSNRLLYGANNESYNNVSVDSEVDFNYNLVNSTPAIAVTPSTAINTTSTSGVGFLISVNLSSIPASSQSPIDILFDIYPESKNLRINDPFSDLAAAGAVRDWYELANFNFNIRKSIYIQSYSNRSEAAAAIQDAIVGNYSGLFSGPWEYNQGTSVIYRSTGSSVVQLSYEGFNSGTNVAAFRFAVKSVFIEVFNQTIGALAQKINKDVFLITQNANNYLVKNSTSVFVNSVYRGFKKDQDHLIGVVYYDSRNRSGAVNKIGSFKPSFSGPFSPSVLYSSLGSAGINIRIKGNAPSWAKRWQLVYSPFSTYSFAYQYSAAEAFTTQTEVSIGKKPIYVSLRHLEGKSDSYKDANGAIFNYSHVKGDRLKVLSYVGAGGVRIYPEGIDFEITNLDIFETNTVLFPFTGVAESRRTGNFLALKDEDYPGWTSEDIAASNSLWSRNVIFEIYRPAFSSEDVVYYEIGQSYPVIFDGSNYRHGGQRDYRYSVPLSLPQNFLNVSAFKATSAVDLRNGDELTVLLSETPSVVTAQITIGTVFQENPGYFFYTTLLNGSYRILSIDNKDDAVVTAFSGDVYFRPRAVKMNTPTAITFIPDPSNLSVYYERIYIEDNSISDFYQSNFIATGRSNAPSKDAKNVFRKASITWSDPYFLDTSVLGLSSFNLSGGNFIDLQAEHGEIKYIHSNSDSIVVLQENKCSVLPVSRNVIEYLDGGAGVTVSNAFIGQQSFYAGDFGVGDFPESFASYYGKLFFADNRNGKVIRISGDGIELISEQGMDAFFQKLFEEVNRRGPQNFKVYGGIDPRNKEYIISIQKISGSFDFENQTVGYDIDNKVWASRYSFMPETMTEINGEMYSFKAGEAYAHTVNSTPRTYYGTAYPSKVSVVSAQNKSMVKSFESVGLESSKPWSFKCSTRTQDTSNVLFSNMTKKEDMFYHEIPTDNNSLPIQMIGTVQTVGGAIGGMTVSVDSNINMLPIEFGSPIFKLVSGSLVATSYTAADITNFKTLTIAGTGAVLVGDVLVARQSGSINGDKLRGNYMLIELEVPTSHTDIQDMELFAINTWFTRNSIHNDLVN
jgi:hypothetical protein